MNSLDWRAVKQPITRIGRGDTIILDGQQRRVISASRLDCGGVELLLKIDASLKPIWFPTMAQIQTIRAEVAQ